MDASLTQATHALKKLAVAQTGPLLRRRLKEYTPLLNSPLYTKATREQLLVELEEEWPAWLDSIVESACGSMGGVCDAIEKLAKDAVKLFEEYGKSLKAKWEKVKSLVSDGADAILAGLKKLGNSIVEMAKKVGEFLAKFACDITPKDIANLFDVYGKHVQNAPEALAPHARSHPASPNSRCICGLFLPPHIRILYAHNTQVWRQRHAGSLHQGVEGVRRAARP